VRLGLSLHVSRDFGQILRYAFLARRRCATSFSDLPAFLPWLLRYFLASTPERALHGAMAECR
jgi:D-amino-acid dehydrogenase